MPVTDALLETRSTSNVAVRTVCSLATAGRILQNVWPFVIPYPPLMATVRPRPSGQVLHSSTGASEQIAAQLRVWLEQEQLETGERIGTEQELADEFGVSRPTMREALRLLSAAHLIRVGRGRSGGIFVARTPSEGMSRNVSESIALMLRPRRSR